MTSEENNEKTKIKTKFKHGHGVLLTLAWCIFADSIIILNKKYFFIVATFSARYFKSK